MRNFLKLLNHVTLISLCFLSGIGIVHAGMLSAMNQALIDAADKEGKSVKVPGTTKSASNVSYLSSSPMSKQEFQKKINDLITPYFAGNYVVGNKSFEQAYDEWQKKINNEYKVVKQAKINECNSLEQRISEAMKKEKLHRAPFILVFSGWTGDPFSESYRVVDLSYVHDYILLTGFSSYRCSHSSLDELKQHMYWIKQVNLRESELQRMLGGNYREVLRYSYDISTGKEKFFLENDGTEHKYDNIDLSDFYREKLSELNSVLIPYQTIRHEEQKERTKSNLINLKSKIVGYSCNFVLGTKDVGIGNVKLFAKKKKCKSLQKCELAVGENDSHKVGIYCKCGHGLKEHVFKFSKGVKGENVLKTLYEHEVNM